jgi:hypothetical protein
MLKPVYFSARANWFEVSRPAAIASMSSALNNATTGRFRMLRNSPKRPLRATLSRPSALGQEAATDHPQARTFHRGGEGSTREQVEVARDVVGAPVALVEQSEVEPALVGCLDEHAAAGRELVTDVPQHRHGVAQVLEDLAHDDEIVAVVPQGAEVFLQIGLQHAHAAPRQLVCPRHVGLEVEAEQLDVARQRLAQSREPLRVSAAQIYDAADLPIARERHDAPHVPA